MALPESFNPQGPNGISPSGKVIPVISEVCGIVNTEAIFEAIAAGNFYSGGHTFLAVADLASVQLLVSTPAANGKLGAASFFVSSGGNALVTYTKGVSTTADGIAVPLFNHNDNSANTIDFSVFRTPTAPTGGTAQITDFPIFGGDRKSLTGGEASDASFRILAPDTKYLINTKNVSGAPVNIFIGAFGIEFEQG